MKKVFYFLMMVAVVSFVITSCNDDDEPEVKKATIGAQANAGIGGFYSVSENKVYTMNTASQNPGVIDILCFYEEANGNNIAIASPGTNISGIFTGANAPENWTTKNTTYFSETTLTVDQFDALAETDQLIINAYDTANDFRKAKDMKVNDIYAFKTQSEVYGLFKVTEVLQGTDGEVTFEVKVKK
jgi:hypothetical protein